MVPANRPGRSLATHSLLTGRASERAGELGAGCWVSLFIIFVVVHLVPYRVSLYFVSGTYGNL